MSKRKVQLFLVFSLRRSNLADMLESIEKVQRYTAGVDFERFAGDDLLVDAVVRNLEIIGEAARHIPETVRRRYTEVPWKRAPVFFGRGRSSLLLMGKAGGRPIPRPRLQGRLP